MTPAPNLNTMTAEPVFDANGWCRNMALAPRAGIGQDVVDIMLHIDGRPPVVAGWSRATEDWRDIDDRKAFRGSPDAWRPLPDAPVRP